MVAGVEALGATASIGDDDPIALLPGPEGGRRNFQHLGHRANAVDRLLTGRTHGS